MITYPLAKQLKDAGFPQEGINKERGFGITNGRMITAEPVLFPTLSELIEACGKEFGSLERVDIAWYTHNYANDSAFRGSTPEEAVANLWLELNKK